MKHTGLYFDYLDSNSPPIDVENHCHLTVPPILWGQCDGVCGPDGLAVFQPEGAGVVPGGVRGDW